MRDPRQFRPISEPTDYVFRALNVADHVSLSFRSLAHFCASCSRPSHPARRDEYHVQVLRSGFLPLHVSRRIIDPQRRRLHHTQDSILSNTYQVRWRCVRDAVLATLASSFTISVPPPSIAHLIYLTTLCVNVLPSVIIAAAKVRKFKREVQAGQSITTDSRFEPKFVKMYDPFSQQSMIRADHLRTLFPDMSSESSAHLSAAAAPVPLPLRFPLARVPFSYAAALHLSGSGLKTRKLGPRGPLGALRTLPASSTPAVVFL